MSIAELKKNPCAVIEQAEGAVVAILKHNKPQAYLVPAAAFEAIVERLEDLELAVIVHGRAIKPTVAADIGSVRRDLGCQAGQ